MTAIGPKAEAALKEGQQFVDGALVALAYGRTLRSRAPESLESFARRVAEIAHAEGFAAGAKAQREMEPTEEMVDAPRQIILYAETPGRSLEGLRDHLRQSGVEYGSWFPAWAMGRGHLTKAAIAILVFRAMQRVAPLVGGEG